MNSKGGILYAFSSRTGAPAPSNRDPYGYLDAAVGGDGTITVGGWAKDDDCPNDAIEVDIYVGGPVGQGGKGIGRIVASDNRSDVGAHGFSATLTTDLRGDQPVYAYAINRPSGNNPQLTNTKTAYVTEPPGSRVIPDGDYIIATACTTDKSELYYVDIQGSEEAAPDGSNVQLYGPVGGTGDLAATDAWTISYDSGFYTIRQKTSGACLDVVGASNQPHANVAAYASNGSDAQRWKITKNGTNGYRLQARCSGMSLDADGGVAEKRVNVQQYSSSDADAQRWLLIPYKPSQPVANGRYVLLSGLSDGVVMDVPGDTGNVGDGVGIQLWGDGAASQFNSFDLTKLSNGYYKVKHAASGKCLEVAGGQSDYSRQLSLYADNGSLAQQWAIIGAGGGKYRMVSRCNGYSVDVQGGGTDNGTKVIQYPYHGGANQTWKLVQAEHTVTFNANGGAGAPASQTKYYKTRLTLSGGRPTRTGYTFKCWNTKADGSGTAYGSGAAYDVEADVTLYAQWTPVKYTLDVNGYLDGEQRDDIQGWGTFDAKYNDVRKRDDDYDAYDSLDYGTRYLIDDIRAADHKRYKGVRSGSLSGTVTGATQVVLEFHSLYDVAFDKNCDGSVSSVPTGMQKEWGADLSIPGTKPTRPGYSFACWNTKADGTGTSYDEGGKYTPNAGATLYAIWEETGSEIDQGAGRSIPDGNYYMIHSLGSTFRLDIEGDAVPCGEASNVRIYSAGGNDPFRISQPEDCDVFTLTYLGNGFYSIKQMGTNMAVTVKDASSALRANVEMSEYIGSNAQQWSISWLKEDDAGYGFKFKSRCSGFVLDVQDGAYENGRNVQQYTDNGDGNQRWIVVPYEPEHEIPDGRYVIANELKNDLYMSVDGLNVKLCDDSEEVKDNSFDVEHVGNGYYKILHRNREMSLGVYQGSFEYYTDIQLQGYNGSNAQLWAIDMVEEGKVGPCFSIRSKMTGQAIGISNPLMPTSSNVQQSPFSYGTIFVKTQLWRFIPAEYEVRYVTNGGNGVPGNQVKYYKEDLVISKDVPTREGYLFKGWGTSAGGEALYCPGDAYRVDEDVTLYAVWVRDVPDFTLPASLVEIEDEAFAGCDFTYVKIGEFVERVGKRAFADCDWLRKVYVPESVDHMDADAFERDGADTALTICGKKGGYAEAYADENGYAFEAE